MNHHAILLPVVLLLFAGPNFGQTRGSVSAQSRTVENSFPPLQDGDDVPQNVIDLWKDYDPAIEPIDKEVVTTFEEDGVVCEYVLFTVASFQGQPSRIAAYYTYPVGGKNLPAFVWAHGGGQRADKTRGMYFARQGYATVDINWNGRELEPGIQKNTDWGKIDPTQGPRFYPKSLRSGGHRGLDPDAHTVDPVISPRNPNWFMLAVAGRRAITFLAKQKEVDPARIGFTGFSMGGNIASFVAIDDRLKAVVPVVGGTGYLSEQLPGYPDAIRPQKYPEWYARTIESGAYWPEVKAPVMFISGTNDFHGRFDFMQRCIDTLPHSNWRISQTMHNNHNPGNQQWLALQYWFDHYLKGRSQSIPVTPESSLTRDDANQSDSQWTFRVTPASPETVESVAVYYSWDSFPSNRYHKFIATIREGNTWQATIPVRTDLPLTAFANVQYPSRTGEAEESLGGSSSSFSITSRFHTHFASTINPESLHADAAHRKFEPVFAEFPKDNPIWGVGRSGSFLTYKFNDHSLKFPASKKLRFVVKASDQRLGLRVSFESSKHLDKKRNELKRTSVSENFDAKGGEFLVSLADLVSRDGKISSWHNVSTMQVKIIDLETKQPVNFLQQDESSGGLTRIEWVD